MSFKTLKTQEPFIVNKNLGSTLQVPEGHMNTHNADGLPIVELNQKQKYDFDRKGWLLFPGVIEKEDVEEMREFALRVANERDGLHEDNPCGLSGPLQKLIDHPVLIGFLNEFLAYVSAVSQESYGFRMETSHVFHRGVGGKQGKFSPHNGSGLFRLPGDSHIYRMIPGKAWSGLTRVVWELNPVKKGQGGTLVISGSHKASYQAPDSVMSPDSPIWDTYECPAGSLLVFTESLTHSADQWTNGENDRVAIFNLYNTLAVRWNDWLPTNEQLESMPPLRRSLFRSVHAGGNVEGGDFNWMSGPYEERE
jgi:hypothetical protein